MEEKKNIDYSKVDKKIEKIIRDTSKYLKIFDKDFIEKEIQKAYIYARNAHE